MSDNDRSPKSAKNALNKPGPGPGADAKTSPEENRPTMVAGEDHAPTSLTKARSYPFMDKVEWLYAEALLANMAKSRARGARARPSHTE